MFDNYFIGFSEKDIDFLNIFEPLGTVHYATQLNSFL